MTARTTLAGAVSVCLTVLAVTIGCTTSTPQASSSTRPPATKAPSSSQPTASPPPAAPGVGSCHRLSLQAATAPTDSRPAVPCGSSHTTVTVRVGHFDPVRDGHLLSVDSRSVQRQIAARCPTGPSGYLGGTLADRRLSRFAVVWFSPTVEQGQAGATWFRCDLLALAGTGPGQGLAVLPAHLHGILDRPHALDRFGTCGSAAPDSPHFDRVICARRHTWRAVSVIPLAPHARFHERPAGAAADGRCKQVAAAAAGGALRYTWAFEWPTLQQWRAGQRYGFCWLPTH